jgi:hypothetical protein
VLGVRYSLTLAATSGLPVTFSVTAGTLPAGLTLDAATGKIAGTPTITALLGGSPVGRQTVVVRAASGAGRADTSPFTFAVSGVSIPTPLVYYTYDTADVTGTVLKDWSPNHYDGTISGGVVQGATGAVGGAFTLDGATGLVRATGVPAPTGSFSMAATVKPAAASLGARIPLQYGISDPVPTFRGSWLQAENDGTILGVFEDGTVDHLAQSTSALSPSRFTPIGLTFDGVGLVGRTFFGGIQEATTTTTGPILYATTNLETGRHPQFGNRFWQGSLDEVAMWQVQLSPEQMATVAWLSLTGQSMKNWIGL